MNSRNTDWQEYAAAAVITFFGLWYAATATTYSVGSLINAGPGYFPLIIGGLLALLGLAVAFEARGKPPEARDFRLRPIAAVASGIVAFALLAETAGFVPAAIVLIVLSGLGEPRTSWLSLLAVAVFIAVLGAALFIWGLGVPLHTIRFPQ